MKKNQRVFALLGLSLLCAIVIWRIRFSEDSVKVNGAADAVPVVETKTGQNPPLDASDGGITPARSEPAPSAKAAPLSDLFDAPDDEVLNQSEAFLQERYQSAVAEGDFVKAGVALNQLFAKDPSGSHLAEYRKAILEEPRLLESKGLSDTYFKREAVLKDKLAAAELIQAHNPAHYELKKPCFDYDLAYTQRTGAPDPRALDLQERCLDMLKENKGAVDQQVFSHLQWLQKSGGDTKAYLDEMKARYDFE